MQFNQLLSNSIVRILILALTLVSQKVGAQQIAIRGKETISGTVRSVGTGTIEVVTKDGKTLNCRIQEPDQDSVAISKGVIRFPATVAITGLLPQESIVKGMSVRLEATVHRSGKTRGKVTELHVSEGGDKAGLEQKEESDIKGFFVCDVTARVDSFRRGRLLLQVAPGGFVTKGRITAELEKGIPVNYRTGQYRKLKAGDKITNMVVARLSTDDLVVESLEAEIVGDNAQSATQDSDAKYSNLSDEPYSMPRSVRSANFLLVTDISDRQARILLDRLEYMVGLVSRYYGRPPKAPIQCVVARNVNAFASLGLPQRGYDKIRSGAGVTMSQTLGRQTVSKVYSCDKFGVVQHEAMHAYCAQTFGSTGPTWYAEGMAEMGNYWKENQLAVDIDPVVITYLRRSEPKKLLKIVEAGQVTGDSWQAYGWRWALCHLLAHNPNYSGRFKALGIGMMTRQEGVTFENVYGPVAQQISFEYDFFVRYFDNGFRADLCAWDWKGTAASKKISGKVRVTKDISAQRGWQPSGVEVLAGLSYDIAGVGTWKVAKNVSCDADGATDEQGVLEGIIMADGKLGEPFKVGKVHRFEAESDGILFVRCKDKWNALADNSGSIKVHIRRTPQ